MTDRPLFSDLTVTYEHEEKLRAESMALIHVDAELSRRLVVIEKAMKVIFGYTIDHTSRNENEATVQLLGIRLFNAAASGVKLALSGYYQTAFQQARDIMETGFLLDYFRTSPEQIAMWKAADRASRRKLFEPVKIREALDKRDGDTQMRRAEQYRQLSELASHATWRGFAMTTREGIGELGPFVRANKPQSVAARNGAAAWTVRGHVRKSLPKRRFEARMVPSGIWNRACARLQRAR
jgi:hypothetical protein